MKRYFLVVILPFLGGCRTPGETPSASTPPPTTGAACAQIRGFFEKHGATSVSPKDVTTECHMRITDETWRSGHLMKTLEKSGWKRDPSYDKAAVPSKFAWETPVTRCTIDELANLSGGSRVHGGVGVSGGSHLSPSFGIGLSLGQDGSAPIDYKIDCADKLK